MALLSGMHHFPPGVPERARRVHERLPAGSALCSSDVGVLIDRIDTEGGLGGLYKHLAHTKEGPLHLVPSITHCAVCALNGEQVPLVVKSSLGNACPRPTVYIDGRGAAFARGCSTASGARAAISNTTCPSSGLLEARQRRVREERPQLAGCGPAAGRSENRAASRPERLKPAPQALRAENKK